MDWNLFWTAFGAIGGTVGALATAVAVIVALWQTKYSQKKKIKIKFFGGIYPVGFYENDFKRYVGIDITNIGNRDIIIQNWGIRAKNKRVMFLNNSTADPVLRLGSVELPHLIRIEESITLCISFDKLKKEINTLIHAKELEPSQKIKFFCSDSAGKVYIVKTPETAKQYALEND